MRTLARRFALLVLPITLACTESAEDEGMASQAMAPVEEPITGAEITTLRNAFMDGIARKDVAAVVNLYTDDAQIHDQDGRIAEGRVLVEESTTIFVNGMNDMTIAPGRFEASGDLAWETGTFAGTFTPPEGRPAPVTGSYLVVVRRGADGTLKVVQDASWINAPAQSGGD